MPQPELPEPRPTLFTRMFGATRYVMTLAVLAVFVGATVLLVVGIIEMAGAVWHGLFGARSSVTESVSLRVEVIEAVDVILVATVLYVIAFGLYQLWNYCAAHHTAALAADLSIGSLEVRLSRDGHHCAEHHRVDPRP